MRKLYLHSLLTLLTVLTTTLALGCSQYGAFDVMDSLAGVDGAPDGVWPAEVANLSAQGDHERVTLGWRDPGSEILDHVVVTVSPSGRRLQIPAGTEQLEVRQLENGTTYSFTLTPIATSGASGVASAIDAVPALPALPDDAWVDETSTSRRRIIIDNSNQEETLSDFQLLVELDASVIDYASTDGTDLRFFDEGSDTELAYEIERWDESGSSLVWVRVPEIAGAYPQDYIWMYWGSGVSTAAHDSAAVWAEYELVYHFSSLASGVASDSSPHNRDGVLRGGPGIESAYVGNGVRVGNAVGSAAEKSYVELSSEDLASITAVAPGAFTVEVYARGDASPQLTSPSGPLMAQSFYNIGWDHNNASYVASFHYRDSSKGWTPVSTPELGGGTWYYLAGTFDGSMGSATGYVDGEVVDKRTGLGSAPGGVVSYLRVGTDGDEGNVFDGIVDEVRIAHVARSADWVAAQQLSMSRRMVTFGPQESKS